MKSWIVAAVLALTPAAAAQAQPAGERVLQTTITIDAPAATLWKAFTEPAAYRRWAGGVAAIDLKVGGAFEASHAPDGHIGDPGNIRHRIVAFEPSRLIVFQNIASPGLPDDQLYNGTCIVLQYESVGPSRTRVTVSHTGFAQGAGYDRLYAFFQQGDAGMLEAMKAAYEAR
jgi:uncharacterized protein YndB with AHSA1/START domain